MATIKGLQALCKYCNEWHDLLYQNQINGTQHLIYICHNRKGNYKFTAAEYLPYKPNLQIESYDSIALVNQKNQLSLLD